MGTTSDKLARIVATKTALANVIATNGGIVPVKFRDYPDALNAVINGDTNLSNAIINLEFESVNWRPETSFEPNVTVVSGSRLLSKDTDYTLSYSNNDSIGRATVTVTGKGSYTGSKIANFTINACNLSNLPDGIYCDIKLSKQIYQQEDQPDENGYYKPTITSVTLIDATSNPEKTTTLIPDTDYVYRYSNNTGSGIGKCIITGIGNYSGESFTQFQIISTNFTNVDSFVSLLEESDFSNMNIGTTTITGSYIEDDSDYPRAKLLKNAVDNGDLIPGSLQWTLIGIDTTPPEYVKYRRQLDDGNYEYCWSKPTADVSGISDDGTQTYIRAWDETIMNWDWTPTNKTIVAASSAKKYYGNNIAWGVSLNITDSDGIVWKFCGHTATFRTTYFITSRDKHAIVYRSSRWETSDVCLWLNSISGSNELSYSGSDITSHGGFTLRLYDNNSMKFLKNVVNSVILADYQFYPLQLSVCKDRFYLLSKKEIDNAGNDGIFCYFNSNEERKQYSKDGSSCSWLTRSVIGNDCATDGAYFYNVKDDGTTKLVDFKYTFSNNWFLPICTIG